ncbi:zinc finger protein 341-like isoform X2 [Diadema setosum]
MQSLLETTSTSTITNAVQDPTAATDDDDIFQCGKCKKQFSSLNSFMNHKREHCVATIQTSLMNSAGGTITRPQPIQATTNSAFSALSQSSLGRGLSLGGVGVVPPSPLAQLQANMVLGEEVLISQYANVEQNLQQLQNTLLNGGSLSTTPFLTSQAGSRLLTSATSVSSGTTSSASSMQQALNIGQQVTNIHIVQPGNITIQQTLPNPSQPQDQQAPMMQAQQPQPPPQQPQQPQQQQQQQPQQQQQQQQHQTLVQPATIMPHRPQSSSSADAATVELTRIAPMTNVQVGQGSDGESLNRPDHIYSLTARRQRRTDTGSKKPGKLRCNYCERTFAKNFDLQQHLRSHTGEKPFQCIVCGRAFAQKSNVKKHMQTHKVWPEGKGATLPSKPILKVTNLGEENSAKNAKIRLDAGGSQDLVEPIPREEMLVDNSYVCNFCNERFKNYYQLKTHMRQHKDEQLYKCILKSCASTFKDLDEFLEHTRSHEKELSYRCHLCNKQFSSLNDLGVHQYSHSLYPNQGPKLIQKDFKCQKCNSKYSSPEALEHHLNTSTHSYPCPECSKVFPCERYLRRHLVSHSTQALHECHICNKKFKSEHYLRSHVLIHTGQKPFTCVVCSTDFNRKDKLKRHMLIHEPTKKFRCPFHAVAGCQMAFNRADKLKAHIITHSGIKPYKCFHCSKTFSRKPNLAEHMKLHTNDFPFRCASCNKGFAREKYLKSHRCHAKRGPKRLSEIEGASISVELASRLIDAGCNIDTTQIEVDEIKPKELNTKKKRGRKKKSFQALQQDKEEEDSVPVKIIHTKTRQVRMRTSAFLNRPKRMRKPRAPHRLKRAANIQPTTMMVEKSPTIAAIEEDLAIIQNVLSQNSLPSSTGVHMNIDELDRAQSPSGESLATSLANQTGVTISLSSDSLMQNAIHLTSGDLGGQTIPVMVTNPDQGQQIPGMEGVVVVVSQP